MMPVTLLWFYFLCLAKKRANFLAIQQNIDRREMQFNWSSRC
jgi:hypothetical protein